jgi:hypothetical protein
VEKQFGGRLPGGPADIARLEDNGETLITEIRIDRRSLVNGLFYGVEGMRVGGTRRLEIHTFWLTEIEGFRELSPLVPC